MSMSHDRGGFGAFWIPSTILEYDAYLSGYEWVSKNQKDTSKKRWWDAEDKVYLLHQY